MYRHKLLIASWILASTSITPVLASDGCQAETLSASSFSLEKINQSVASRLGEGVQTELLEFAINPVGDDVQVTHRLQINAHGLLNGIREQAQRDAEEASSESHVFTAGTPKAFVSNGKLIVQVPLTYTLKAWVKFDWICCRRFKCRKCYERKWTKIVQKTIDLQVAIEGRWDPELDLVASELPVDLRAGRTEERLIHGLGKIFPGMMDKLREAGQNLDDEVESLRLSKVREDLPRLRRLSHRKNAEDFVISFERNLMPVWFGFEKNARSEALLSLKQTGTVAAEVFCPNVRPRLRETLAYLDSFRRSPACEVITPQRYLSHISDEHYGNASCHTALAQLNRVRGVDTTTLHPGDTILVPPMYKILEPEGNAASVRQGDSRWSIGKLSSGSNGKLPMADLDTGEDPNLIFPCQYVLADNHDYLIRFVAENDVCPAKISSQATQ